MSRLNRIEAIRRRAMEEIKVLLSDIAEDDFEIEVNIFPAPEIIATFQKEAKEEGWQFDRPADPQLKGWWKSNTDDSGGCVTVYI